MREIIQAFQRGLVVRDGRIEQIVGPGRHTYYSATGGIKIHVFDASEPAFVNPFALALIRDRPDLVEQNFALASVKESEVAVVRADGKVIAVLPPGSKRLFWTVLQDIGVELFDISADYEIPTDKAKDITPLMSDQVLSGSVVDGHIGLLYVDGELVRTLNPGPYAFWQAKRSLLLAQIDQRIKEKEVAGQEILTKDRVTIRLNVTCHYKIEDVRKATANLADLDEYIHKTLQFGIRQAVGTRSLDELLEDKEALDATIHKFATEKLGAYGIVLDGVGVKDIILPGEIRDILNRVVEAEKQAQANLIRRREETAATRSLLNTAKLMEDNPTLLRLKELETLERLVERVGTLNVYGGLDGLLDQLVALKK